MHHYRMENFDHQLYTFSYFSVDTKALCSVNILPNILDIMLVQKHTHKKRIIKFGRNYITMVCI